MNNNAQMPWNQDILNIIAIASYLISVENLSLNKQQTSTDELNKHLHEQDDILKEQNDRYLEKIIEQNNEIINILKGGRHEGKRND